MLTCPACESTLSPRRRQQVEVDFCEKCAGTWFDGGELEALRAADPVNRPAETGTRLTFFPVQAQPPVRCPRCAIVTLQYGSVRHRSVAHCKTCGGYWIPRWRSKSNIDADSVAELALRGALEVITWLSGPILGP